MSITTTSNETEAAVFRRKLQGYQEIINQDITQYSKQLQITTLQEYGKNARLEIDAFLDILARGGKRIRGALVMLGYEMSGGTNQDMILQAARAVEMLHAYLLIIDDIQDRSSVRRGGPSAHTMLADYHKNNHMANGSGHFGLSIALNAALSGSHAAQLVLIGLDVPPDVRLKAIRIINQTMMITAHGQTNDIVNEVVAEVDERDIERVLEWKTAHYTFLNPLSVGMVLAGADDSATEAIADYAMHAGKAFQITDDIMGTFGSQQDSGKSPMDDIREGKQTLLTHYALTHSSNGNKNFLIQMLGKSDITQAEYNRCKDIIIQSGALDHASKAASRHIDTALHSLQANSHSCWSDGGLAFLRGLAQYLLSRKA